MSWDPIVVQILGAWLVVFEVVVRPVAVQVLIEWCRHASSLLPATFLVALVFGVGVLVAVAAFVLAVGFPIFETETILTTIEQISVLWVSLAAPHTVALGERLLTTTPNQKFHPHMW